MIRKNLKSPVGPALIFASTPCAILAGYALSYFACMADASVVDGGSRYRYFSSMSRCAFYSPAARVEAVMTGDIIWLAPAGGPATYDTYPNYDDWFSVYFHEAVIRENAEKQGWWFPW